MLNQNGGSKTDVTVKVILIFFVSLLFFSVGTFVGKQVSDSDYRRAALEEDFKGARSTASVHPQEEYGEDKTGLSEEDIASLTEEFVHAEKEGNDHQPDKEKMDPVDHNEDNHTTAKHSEPAHAPENQAKKETHKVDNNGYKKMTAHKKNSTTTASHHTTKESKSNQHKMAPAHKPEAQRQVASAANRVAQGLAPVADPQKKRKPDSVLPSVATSSIGKYTVQIASYATEKEAKKHVEKLKTQGFSAFFLTATVRGTQWFRVNVGLFGDHKSAMIFRKELMQQTGIKSSLIQKIIR